MRHKGWYIAWMLFLVVLLGLGAWLIAAVSAGNLPRYPSRVRERVPGVVTWRLLR